jgi:hypothetical protein
LSEGLCSAGRVTTKGILGEYLPRGAGLLPDATDAPEARDCRMPKRGEPARTVARCQRIARVRESDVWMLPHKCAGTKDVFTQSLKLMFSGDARQKYAVTTEGLRLTESKAEILTTDIFQSLLQQICVHCRQFVLTSEGYVRGDQAELDRIENLAQRLNDDGLLQRNKHCELCSAIHDAAKAKADVMRCLTPPLSRRRRRSDAAAC